MLGLIPRPVHGVLDYLWGLAFVAAPHLFGYAGDRQATLFSRVMGGGALAMGLLTRYELGLIKVLPFNLHLLGDGLNAVAGFAGPAVLGFGNNAKARQVVLGFVLVEIAVLLLSKRDPQ